MAPRRHGPCAARSRHPRADDDWPPGRRLLPTPQRTWRRVLRVEDLSIRLDSTESRSRSGPAKSSSGARWRGPIRDRAGLRSGSRQLVVSPGARPRSPSRHRRRDAGRPSLVPEDRAPGARALHERARERALAVLRRSRAAHYRRPAERTMALSLSKPHVRPPPSTAPAGLSGGNQQKMSSRSGSPRSARFFSSTSRHAAWTSVPRRKSTP